VAEIAQTAAPTAWTPRYFPPGAFGRFERLASEVLVELLLARVDAPALAIDDDTNEVGFGCGQVVSRDMHVQDGAQERRVLVGVEQRQRPIPADLLLVVHEVQRQVNRVF